MNITVNTAQLAKKLRLVEQVIAQKAILPIAQNVRLHADIGELTLATTNMEVSMTTACPAQINAQGVTTVPAKALLNVVSQISDEQTHLAMEKTQLRIAAGAFKMRLSTLPADDFPALPDMPAGGVLIPGDLFKNMIKRVRYAISDTDKRYFMNGALLSMTDALIALVTTDGMRLSLTATKRTAPGQNLEVIIPTKTLDLILSDDGHEDIMFNKDTRQLFFVSDDNVLTSRQVSGTFPNYKRIIPKDNPHAAKIPRLPLLAAIKRVALAANETRAVTLALTSGSLSLTSANVQVGDAVEHLPVAYDGPDLKIGFVYTFIEDFLNAADGASIDLLVKDAAGATTWRDGSEFMNVIMPQRI